MVPICPLLPGQEVEQLFRLIDADGDGTLDYVELDIVMKTVQAVVSQAGSYHVVLMVIDTRQERKSKQGRVSWPQQMWYKQNDT